jgi:signal transduction histidine kinase
VAARRHFDPTRALQWGFVVLLSIAAAQVVWWILDEVWHTQKLHDALVAEYNLEVEVARTLLDRGTSATDVSDMFPQVVFSSGPERVAVNPMALAQLEDDRIRRLRRIGWEGAFFLLVLVAAMAVLAQALHQDAQLRRRQQNFLAAVTHEFKSPLASIKLSAETLALRDPPPEKRRALVDRLLADIDRMDAMIGNILDTARLEEGRVQLQPERVSVASAVRALADEIGPRAAAAGVSFTAEAGPELEVQADPIALRTVLRNLVDNAIKATVANGGGTVSLRAEEAGAFVKLVVRDTGVGFAANETNRLFEKFYRPGDELRRKTRGSGLGLYIVRRFVELEHGRVSAHSDGPGHGAVFTVLWPMPRGERA